MLLAPTASLAAPTPAIPPITTFLVSADEMQRRSTSRHGLPSRSQLSYTSPLPSTAEESPSYRQSGMEKGSLMSWDQLAKESSRTLTEEEAGEHDYRDGPTV